MPLLQSEVEVKEWIHAKTAARPAMTERDVVARMRDGDRLRFIPRQITFSTAGMAGQTRDLWLGRDVLSDPEDDLVASMALRGVIGEMAGSVAGCVDFELLV